MNSNQRARLVLNPLTLVVALLVLGVAAGATYLLLRRGNAADSVAASAATAPNGDIVLSSDELDFGTMRSDRAVVRQLLLRNHGNAPARLRIDASDRILAEPRSLEISSNSIARVFLTARPGEPGPWEDEIHVVREGTDEAPLVVRLRGSSRAASDLSARASGEIPSSAVDVAYVDAAIPSAGDGAGDANATRGTNSASSASSATAGSVEITRSSGSGGGTDPGDAGSADPKSPRGSAQLPSGYSQVARSISERPIEPASDSAEDGEEPSPIHRKTPSDIEKKKETEPRPGISALVITSSSTVNLMGSSNIFSPQQVVVLGSASGGSFSLASPLSIPRIPLAFGQSMQFIQRGSAVGSFDPGSGQVVLNVAVDSVDSSGHSAPFVVQLTTGSVVTRNTGGILVSVNGEARATGSGLLRLVGIAKIPEGYRSGAEMELVTFDLVATLQFAAPANDSPSASSGGL